MSEVSREALLGAAFVKLADTLTENFDLVDLLHTLIDECVRIFDVQAGGLMLADEDGRLELVASSSERAELVEVMQLNAGSGPCVECFETGTSVVITDIEFEGLRWPEFRQEALAQGFRSIYAAPMRLRGGIIGTLNLLATSPQKFSEVDAGAIQSLADAATITILQERLLRESTIITAQLNRALTSRVFIEQAKGVLSQSESITMDEAFTRMRNFARASNRTLQDVAEAIANRSLVIGSPH